MVRSWVPGDCAKSQAQDAGEASALLLAHCAGCGQAWQLSRQDVKCRCC